MSQTADAFETLMNAASDPSWRAHMNSIRDQIEVSFEDQVDDAVYLAAFSTPAGRAVLQDLMMRFVFVSRFVPGDVEGAGHYREGAASVVFDIAARIEGAAQGEDDADES